MMRLISIALGGMIVLWAAGVLAAGSTYHHQRDAAPTMAFADAAEAGKEADVDAAGPDAAPDDSKPSAREATAASETKQESTGDEKGSSIPSLGARLWRSVGVLHPVIVHFPIALLLVAGGVEVFRRVTGRGSAEVVNVCFVIGALGAVASTVLGWSSAIGRTESTTLALHRWLGVGTAGLAAGVALLIPIARFQKGELLNRLRLLGVLASAALVGLVGHFGGQLVYGSDYIERAIAQVFNPQSQGPNVAAAGITGNSEGENETTPTLAPDTVVLAKGDGVKVDFRTQVWPILKSRCVECHGPNKAKGDLRLHTEADALEGGTMGPAYTPGKPDESEILYVLTSPFADERMPPPEEGNPVTAFEYNLLRRWIEQGAAWSDPAKPEAKAETAEDSAEAP